MIAVLPTVAANAPEPIDFWTSSYCRVLTRFLKRQTFIRRVFVSHRYCLKDFRHGARPREVPVEGTYSRVVHLGFPGFPEGYVPEWIARVNGLRLPEDDFRSRFSQRTSNSVKRPYVACHFHDRRRIVELRGVVSRWGFDLWHPPAGLWDAEQFDEVASMVAAADFFVGQFSCLSQIAALARTPMLVLVEPVRRRAVPWFRPPDHDRAWYADWSERMPLPNLEFWFANGCRL